MSPRREKYRGWRIPQFLEAAGPGLVTGAADDDPSGIGTYTMAGALFGPTFLWTAFLSWPLMAGVQLACARVGMVTGEGLMPAIAKKIPRWLVIASALALFAANTLNVAADLGAMADASRLLTGIPSAFFVAFYAVALTWSTVFLRYAQIAKVLKWLALFLFAYVIAAFTQHPDWRRVVAEGFVPHVPDGRDGWSVLAAILGTTISPYLFFWQASQEIEEEKSHGHVTVASRRGATARQLFLRRVDVGAGTFFSNLVMFFIILTASLALHAHGKTNIETSSQAAAALEPLAGKFASLLYTVGLVGTGLLAIPTLTGSAAYALADTFRWRQGLDERWNRAEAFYGTILMSTLLAVALDALRFNPIRALFWSAVANGALAPFLLVALFLVIRDRVLMHGQPSPLGTRVTVALAALAMFVTLGFLVFGG